MIKTVDDTIVSIYCLLFGAGTRIERWLAYYRDIRRYHNVLSISDILFQYTVLNNEIIHFIYLMDAKER